MGLWMTPALAQDDGFDWVTIGDPGNVGYDRPDPAFRVSGRGSVSYEYRIGRTEITTGQWLEFVNAFGNQLPQIEPVHWGAYRVFAGDPWVLRTDVPDAAMLPVAGISWEDAALYVNWLHNGKREDLASTQSGVYDTSTFTFNNDGTFNHQLVPSSGAKYWIPTWDEWLKAAHYDPDRYGAGQGGWWEFPNSSDQAPMPGLPGEGDTTYTLQLGGAEWDVPLGAYPHVQSPWGLLDLSGGVSEWTSSSDFDLMQALLWDGGSAGRDYGAYDPDHATLVGSMTPEFGGGVRGIRLAAPIPTPGCVVVLCVSTLAGSKRRRDTR